MRPTIACVTLAASLFLTGCVFSPVGLNTSNAAITVAEGGKVTLAVPAPAGTDPAKITLQVDGHDTVTGFDDSPTDGFSVELDVSSLAPQVYTALVFVDENEEASGQMVFVVPDPNAGQAPAEGGEAAADAPAEETPAE